MVTVIGAVWKAATYVGLKTSEVGEKIRFWVADSPVPVKATDWGLPSAVSVKSRLAVRMPLAVGAKATLTAQEAPGTRVVPQVFEASL